MNFDKFLYLSNSIDFCFQVWTIFNKKLENLKILIELIKILQKIEAKSLLDTVYILLSIRYDSHFII